jgi:predicted cupin superfamily sugar epimerase
VLDAEGPANAQAREGGRLPTAAEWIEALGLEPHPEGGFYRETYRAATEIGACCRAEATGGARPVSTAIYFLLPGTRVSALHRIRSDEVWHHYAGSPLTLHLLGPSGAYRRLALGPRPEQGQRPQVVVPARTWFGATVDDRAAYTLVGCTVAPGFDFADFELARRAELIRRFPRHRAVIEALTR